MSQTTAKLRTTQLLQIGVAIAAESGFLALDCYSVAARAGVHHNLVRRYLGRRDVLHSRVAMAAYAAQLAGADDLITTRVVCEAQTLGILHRALGARLA